MHDAARVAEGQAAEDLEEEGLPGEGERVVV